MQAVFLYTLWPIVPSTCLFTSTVRDDGKALLFSVSVNLMFCWILFRNSRNLQSSSAPCGCTTKLLSIYLNQWVGLCCLVLSTVSSEYLI
jgi:hypothetical protein